MNALDKLREATDRITKPPQVRSAILFVDDEPLACKYVTSTLLKWADKRGEQRPVIKTACSADEAAQILADDPHIAVVVTDLRMPGHDGFWLAEHVRREYPQVEVAAMTAHHELSEVRCDLFYDVYDKPLQLKKFERDLGQMVLKAS